MVLETKKRRISRLQKADGSAKISFKQHFISNLDLTEELPKNGDKGKDVSTETEHGKDNFASKKNSDKVSSDKERENNPSRRKSDHVSSELITDKLESLYNQIIDA